MRLIDRSSKASMFHRGKEQLTCRRTLNFRFTRHSAIYMSSRPSSSENDFEDDVIPSRHITSGRPILDCSRWLAISDTFRVFDRLHVTPCAYQRFSLPSFCFRWISKRHPTMFREGSEERNSTTEIVWVQMGTMVHQSIRLYVITSL